MEVSLVPEKSIESFCLGWNELVTIQVLLYYLGYDLTNLDPLNEGMLVPAKDARGWGEAIQTALDFDELIVARISKRSSAGFGCLILPISSREDFEESIVHVEGGGEPRSSMELFLLILRRFSVDYPDLARDEPVLFVEGYGRLSEEQRRMLDDFARFCIKSNGFRWKRNRNVS